jgi:hypothetical protein
MYLGKLMENERMLLERAEVELTRRSGSELDLYDGRLKAPKEVAALLQVADWSVPGAFPKPPFYTLAIDDPHFVRTAPQLAIFVDKIQLDRNSETATVFFLTQLPYDAAWA